MANNEVFYEIIEKIAVLKKEGNGFQKELNIVSWCGSTGKVDIRSWKRESGREYMTRGITLFEDEAIELMKALNKKYGKE